MRCVLQKGENGQIRCAAGRAVKSSPVLRVFRVWGTHTINCCDTRVRRFFQNVKKCTAEYKLKRVYEGKNQESELMLIARRTNQRANLRALLLKELKLTTLGKKEQW
eukprot:1161942-Pelagomonas_calceolata.AAC.2